MKIGLHDHMSNLRLGFLILNYKSARLTKKLSIQVRNKFSNHNVNICVVNNDDDISDAEKGDLIEVSDDFISGHGNIGYACGNNKGIRLLASMSDAIFVLNPDIEIKLLSSEFVTKQIPALLSSKFNVGSIHVNGVADYDSGRLFDLLFPFFSRSLKGGSKTAVSRELYRFHGCAFVINCHRLDASAEFFDESTFLYYEEQIAVKKMGYRTVSLTGMTVDHVGSVTVNETIRFKKYIFQFESLVYLLRLYFKPDFPVTILKILAFISVGCRFILDLLRKAT